MASPPGGCGHTSVLPLGRGILTGAAVPELVLEVLVGVCPPCCPPVCVACLAWGISVAHVPPCATAQVPGTGVQPPRDLEVFQQARHEYTTVTPAVAEEAEDEVDAGLTLSHGPGKQCAHCLAKVLQHIGEALLVDIRRRVHIVSAEVAVEGVVDMRL